MISFKDLIAIQDSSLNKLTTTTKLTGKETEPVWQNVNFLYMSKSANGKGHLFHNLSGTLINACLTELKKDFDFSRSIAIKLAEQDEHIVRKTLSGDDLDIFFAKAKAAGMIEVLEAPSSKGGDDAKPGRYRITIKEVVEYIDKKIADHAEFLNFTQQKLASQNELPGVLPQRVEVGGMKTEGGGVKDEGTGEGISPQESFSSEEQPKEDSNLILAKDEVNPLVEKLDNSVGTKSYKPGDEFSPSVDSRASIPLAIKDFNSGLKSLPRIGSKTENWEKYASAMISLIASSKTPLFNEWGDFIGDWLPPGDQVDAAILQDLKKKFKDKSGLWSLDGEIGVRASDLILGRVRAYLISSTSNASPDFHDCEPNEWKIFSRVKDVLDKKLRLQDEVLAFLMCPDEREKANQTLTNDEISIFEKINPIAKAELEAKYRKYANHVA